MNSRITGQLFLVLFLFLTSRVVYSIPNTSLSNKHIVLQVVPQKIVVDGKPSLIYRIKQPDGTLGITANEGDILNITVENKTDQPTSIHWHGLILPNNQDGVPYVTQFPIMPGKKYDYRFKLVQSGTYWMHSHFRFQEQKLLAAPFIIKSPDDASISNQEVVIILEDFSFKNPKILYKALRCKQYKKKIIDTMPAMNITGKGDYNDVNYDAFLANERTLMNPQLIPITPNTRVRLRIINASASTNFFIETGKLESTIIAVDGQNIQPRQMNPFQLGIGQRVDILVQIPNGEGSYPILAQVEGTDRQTGFILATQAAVITKPGPNVNKRLPGFDYSQEIQLRTQKPLPQRSVSKIIPIVLQGNMMSYVWKINNQIWPNMTPITVTEGDRVELVFDNQTPMSHPMHLHGHTFQVTNINGQEFLGAKRDTFLVLPHSKVKIQFDASYPGAWLFHCHNLYHAAAGMMTKIMYQDFAALPFTPMQEAKMSGSHLYMDANECK